jgi:hypothetical protein
LRAADDLLRERAGTTKPKDMLKYLRRATVIPERSQIPLTMKLRDRWQSVR